MPVAANVLPISRALATTLRDSLDIYHKVVSDVTVRVLRLSALGLDLWQTALALLLVLFGFVTYYVIPYAFTFQVGGVSRASARVACAARSEPVCARRTFRSSSPC